MGCTDSRKSKIEGEEKILVKLEEQLEFCKNSCLIADLCFRKYSHDSQINENQWKEIAFTLCLNLENSRSRPKIESFFSSYKEKSHYHFQPLLLAAILLSDGYYRQKAKLVFELYDSDHNGQLDEKDIQRIITDLVDLSLYKIPILLSEPDTDVQKYVQGLIAYEEKIKTIFVEKFKNAKTINAFVNAFRAWNVFSPYDLRTSIAFIKQTDFHPANSRDIEENGNLS